MLTDNIISTIVLLEKGNCKFVSRGYKINPCDRMIVDQDVLTYKKGQNKIEIGVDDAHIYLTFNDVYVGIDKLWELRQFIGSFRDEEEKEAYLNAEHIYPIYSLEPTDDDQCR